MFDRSTTYHPMTAGNACLRAVAKCLRGVTAKRRYRGGVSKFLGFLLGAAVALAGPAVFGVLTAPGGIELNAKEMALAFGIGALIFWTVVSYFSGAGALGAFVAFGTLIYCWHWIPNRTTNFLNDVPGVTTGMIEGSRQYTLNGVVPILTVISLVYAIQLIVRSVQRRRRERAEAERLQREQEAAQAQQEAEAAALYPVAGSTYPAAGAGYGGNSSRYDDLFDEDPDPEPVRPRSQAEEQTRQLPVNAPEQTAQLPDVDARGNDTPDETVAVPTNRETTQAPDRDETTQVPADRDETTQVPADRDETTQVPVGESTPPTPEAPNQDQQPVAKSPQPASDADDHPTVTAPIAPANQPATPPTPAAQPTTTTPTTPPTTADDETVAAPTPQQEKPEQSPPVAKAQEPNAPAGDEPTVVAPGTAAEPQQPAKPQESGAPERPRMQAGDEPTVVAPAEGDGARQVAGASQEERGKKSDVEAAAGPQVKEQVGQQYRERMDDPEDTGEFYLSAFETPNMSIRPAGA
ncbi:hypothetical protein GCM10009743_40320 [Kribbella swartbergensis]